MGFWAGGCSAIYDPDTKKFYLYYRVRKPLDQGRGGECHVAESDDGVNFTTIWTGKKEEFGGAESIEAAALIKSLDGKYRLYISYVNPSNRKWDLDLLEADHPSQFDPAKRIPIYGAEDLDSEGVKDPYVAIVGGQYYLFVHYAPRALLPDDATYDELHGTGNVFATDKGKGSSGLAISSDGINFTWMGDILPPGKHWDRKLTRIDTMLYEPPVFTILYSGRSDVKETYEDRTGIAISLDLQTFHKLTEEAPALSSPHNTGALRYSDAVPMANSTLPSESPYTVRKIWIRKA